MPAPSASTTSRRSRLGIALAFTLLATAAPLAVSDRGAAAPPVQRLPAILTAGELDALTIPDIQERMSAGQLSSTTLTLSYLARIREVDDELQAVLAVNPLALLEAARSDLRRHFGGPRSVLEGVPVLLKDNIDVAAGRLLSTTAGSRALLRSRPADDAGLVKRLRGGRRRDHRQGELVRVGQLPQHQFIERVECGRRADRQRPRPRSQSLRLVIGFRRGCRGVAGPGGDRHGDRRFDRLPRRRERRRRAQAHPRVGLACRGRADLGGAGHGGPDGPSCRRRRAHPRCAPGLRCG